MGSWQCPRNVDDSVTITKVIACSNNPALSSPSMSLPSLPLFLHAAIPRVLPSVARRVGSLSASPSLPPPPFPSARATRLHFLPTSPSSVRVASSVRVRPLPPFPSSSSSTSQPSSATDLDFGSTATATRPSLDGPRAASILLPIPSFHSKLLGSGGGRERPREDRCGGDILVPIISNARLVLKSCTKIDSKNSLNLAKMSQKQTLPCTGLSQPTLHTDHSTCGVEWSMHYKMVDGCRMLVNAGRCEFGVIFAIDSPASSKSFIMSAVTPTSASTNSAACLLRYSTLLRAFLHCVTDTRQQVGGRSPPFAC